MRDKESRETQTVQRRRKRTEAPAGLNIRIILLITQVTLPRLILPRAPSSAPNSLDFNFNQGANLERGWYVGDNLRLHLTNSGPLLILYQSIRA